ncbi:putative zinc finger protein 840 isoform X1 [Mya arenaria]|uniref:putative zinc finger protein 840 isoform X1 n=1 Tax=Mya arenaria TaxID=6604 RepID=UPI0022E8D624|nr:putative zinc finger protein 840 isoform X1 [Mya arenaria]
MGRQKGRPVKNKAESSCEESDDEVVGRFACDLCPVVFQLFAEYTEHLKSHFEGKKHLCDKCDQKFDTQKELNDHTAEHDGNLKYECALCKLRFPSSVALEDHAAGHSEELQCEHCKKTFKLKIKFRKHEIDFLNKNKCCVCDGDFPCRAVLVQHVRNKHAAALPEERPFQCSLCNKCFKCKQNLLGHFESHEEKKYTCETCGAKYRNEKQYLKHVKEHEDPSQCVCKVCKFTVKRPSAMRSHMRIHEQEAAIRERMQHTQPDMASINKQMQHAQPDMTAVAEQMTSGQYYMADTQ